MTMRNEAWEALKIRQRMGGTTRVYGSAARSIGTARSQGDSAWTIYTNGKIFQEPAPGQPAAQIQGYLPFVRVRWGSADGAPQSALVIAGRRIVVVGSQVDVEGFVQDTAGVGAPSDVYGEFGCSIAQGTDGQTLLPSVWAPAIRQPPDHHGLLYQGSGALRTVSGYNAGATEGTLMFFDAPAEDESDPATMIADGLQPMAAILAGPTDNFEAHYGDGIPFVNGLVFVISSNRLELARLAGGQFRVDVEIVTL